MAVRRVVQTETIDNTPETVEVVDDKASTYSAFDQFVYLVFGIIETLLLLRFVFGVTGANRGASIVNMVYSITDILMAPFNFVFPANAVAGSVFEWSVIVAMIFYALLAWIIMKIIRIMYTADA